MLKLSFPNWMIFLMLVVDLRLFANDITAFKIGSTKVSVKDLYQENKGDFYELEKQKFELIERLGREKFLEGFWQELGKNDKTTPEKARENYLDKNAQVSDSEVKQSMSRFANHPRLKDLSDEEKDKQIRDYLKNVKVREALDKIVQDGKSSGKFVIVYPEPQEPKFSVPIENTDPIKYGPSPDDTKPVGCSGSKCPITVVEYSEFQCPFCERVLPSVSKLMEEYKGKVQWVVRDFPLGFHNRARPAALAARCAMEQGKYWHMYEELFRNQRSLEDKDFKKYAKNINLNMEKFAKCYDQPSEANLAIIEKNYRSGEKLGVTGTPAFFINGRRMSGALPYAEFRRVFEEELNKKK